MIHSKENYLVFNDCLSVLNYSVVFITLTKFIGLINVKNVSI